MILIDGNSLLNRAFYAMNMFTTSDNTPVNAVFGFVKLIIKLIENEKPKYFAVAFDVHAPTFRHKLYPDYKGTRRPAPEEFATQIPIIKSLLNDMKIRTVELAGYEADDILGTLSRAYDGVEVFIYTGDRDAYQLVKEHVSVCFTKRGVSEIDLHTAENFYAKEGLEPYQIIELKSLMGDSSDNIPGVKGIGVKSANELLQKYGTLDGVYEHIDELSPAVRKKLLEGKDAAYLSRLLATIDTAVPVEVPLESCLLRLPFSEEARLAFSRLEFRSLIDGAYFPARQKAEISYKKNPPVEEFFSALEEAEEFAFVELDGVHVFTGGTEYAFTVREDFFTNGLYQSEIDDLIVKIFSFGKRAIVYDLKAVLHRLDELDGATDFAAEDVSLLCHLASGARPSDVRSLCKDALVSEENCAYALDIAYRAGKKEMTKSEEKLYDQVEMPLLKVLFEMERVGVRVDVKGFAEFSKRFGAELNELSERIYEIAGERFNLNSPLQLSDILFNKLALKRNGVKKTAYGGYSTSADVLEQLAGEHEIARLILSYREVQKLQSTYIDGILPLVKDGVVHTTYFQTMTSTGRLSSANPNLQNIPVRNANGKELRKLFIAREGNVLIDADYSQIELRLLAHFSGCEPLIQAYREGRDLHATTAAQVFGVSLNQVTDELRRRAKAVNFGVIYGISSYGLSREIGVSVREAQEYIERYFATYPEIKTYMDGNVQRAREQGYVTTVLDRKRMIPEIRSSNHVTRSFGERAAMNMPLQGSSADIIKIAMIRVQERLKKENLQAKLVLQVHDELVADTPEGEAEAVERILKEEMEGAISLRVPLTVDVKRGKSWYEAK